MAISPALNIGAQGMQTGMTQLNRSANDIARLNTETRPGDSPALPAAAAPNADRSDVTPESTTLESAMVDQVQAQHLVQSNARTVEVASDNLGTLLDLRA